MKDEMKDTLELFGIEYKSEDLLDVYVREKYGDKKVSHEQIGCFDGDGWYGGYIHFKDESGEMLEILFAVYGGPAKLTLFSGLWGKIVWTNEVVA